MKYNILGNGEIYESFSEVPSYIRAGTARQTRELAEKARDEIKVFQLLLNERDKRCPEFKFTRGKPINCEVYYDYDIGKYFYYCLDSCKGVTSIYFPEEIAKQICRELNDGVLKL